MCVIDCFIVLNNMNLTKQGFAVPEEKGKKDRERITQLEKELKESRVNFQNMVNMIPEALIIFDENGTVMDVNPAACDQFQYSRDEALNNNILDFLVDEDASDLANFVSDINEKGHSSKDVAVRRKDGSKMNRKVLGVPVSLNGNTFYITLGRDVTVAKKAEMQARESEEKLRSLFKTMAQGVVFQNANGEILNANPAAEELLGLTLDQMQGRSSIDPRWKSIHEDGSDFPGNTHPAMIALKTGKEVKGVIMGVFHPRLEEYRWIYINAIPQFHNGGEKPYQVYATFEDFTERKKVVEALKESENRYRALFDNMSSGVAIYQPEGDGEFFVFRDLNQTGARLLNLKISDVIGEKLHVKFPGVKDMGLHQVLTQVYKSGKPARHPVSHYEDNRLSEWFENYIYMLPSGEIVAVFDDITARKRAEDELRKSEQGLQDAQKMSHLGSWEIDLVTGHALWSDEVFRINGFTPGSFEPNAESGMKRLHPDDVKRAEKAYHNAIENGTNYEVESRIVRPTGEVRYVLSKGEVLKGADQRPIKMLGSILDITGRKIAELEREKLITELQDALQEVKQLKGFLPICAHCKKIRDDEGYWDQVESYIAKHTDATFSHGICPECMKEFYPEVDLTKKDE